VSREELVIFEQQLRPALDCAPSAVRQNEVLGVPEGRLGLFYCDLVPKDLLVSRGAGGTLSLAQRLKNMSNIPLFQNKDAGAVKEDNGAVEETEKEEQDLLGGVMEALNLQEEEDR